MIWLLLLPGILMALTIASPLWLSPPWWPWIVFALIAQVVGVLATLVVIVRELDKTKRKLEAWVTPFAPKKPEEVQAVLDEAARVETTLRQELDEARTTLEKILTGSPECTPAERKVLDACGALARRLDPDRLRAGRYVKRADQILLAELVELIRAPEPDDLKAPPA